MQPLTLALNLSFHILWMKTAEYKAGLAAYGFVWNISFKYFASKISFIKSFYTTFIEAAA